MAKLDVIRPKKVTLLLGNKERCIKYDLNAFAELEEKFGSVDNAMNKLKEGSIGSIRTILWAGLIHEEVVLNERTGDVEKYNITPYQVGSWITPAMVPEIADKLSVALNDSVPTTEEGDIKKEIPSEVANPKMATVVLTEEEKKKQEEEAKNS